MAKGVNITFKIVSSLASPELLKANTTKSTNSGKLILGRSRSNEQNYLTIPRLIGDERRLK